MDGGRPAWRIVLLALLMVFTASDRGHAANRLSLTTNLEYEMAENTTTDKLDGSRSRTDRRDFSQIYSLDLQKEVFPTLDITAGGLFRHDRACSDTDGTDNQRTEQAIRPYLGLQFDMGPLRAISEYRKNELRESGSQLATQRFFLEEYHTNLDWRPVELPRLELDWTRTLVNDRPLTTDQRVDTVLLRSRYQRGPYRFRYTHGVTDTLNRLNDAASQTHTDRASVHYNRSFAEQRGSISGSLRLDRLQADFSGPADRTVPTRPSGTLIGTRDDDLPASSDPDTSFSLDIIDLLVDTGQLREQFSFGLDFSSPTRVDTLEIGFADLNNQDSSAWPWRIFVRDSDTELWREIIPVTVDEDLVENRIRLSFAPIRTRFIKIVTRQSVSDNEDLFINDLIAKITLPPDTSEFTATDVTGDLSLNWRLNPDTTTGVGLFYRQEWSEPFDDEKTQLSTEARLQHRFNRIFVGRVRAEQSLILERKEGMINEQSLSAALAADYLETFDQSLTFGFSRLDDEDAAGDELSSILLLRNNLLLYPGWSLVADGGLSWRHDSEGEQSDTSFVRLGSSVEPNRWLNLSGSYSVEWERRENAATRREQEGSLALSWVPTRTLSLSGEWSINTTSDPDTEDTWDQRYSVNWSPLRDGTLDASVAYAETRDNDGETTWTLSPELSWQVNRKTRLALDYSKGEREDEEEIVAFQSATLELRFFY